MEDATATPEVEPPSFQEVDISSTDGVVNPLSDLDGVPISQNEPVFQEGESSSPHNDESPTLHDDEPQAPHDNEVLLIDEKVEVSHEVHEVTSTPKDEDPTFNETVEISLSDEVKDSNSHGDLGILPSHDTEVAKLADDAVPICHEVPSSHDVEEPTAHESVEISLNHEVNEPVKEPTTELAELKSSHETVKPISDEVAHIPTSHEIIEPSSHNSIAEDDDLPSSQPVAFERTESIKENPFNRMSESRTGENNLASDEKENAPEEVPKIEDVEVTKPSEISKEQKSPMVVSVGTIEVNGSNQYEDINIMSKGSSTKEEEPKKIETEESEENKEFESLRDLRFSSISIYDKPHFEEDIIITVDDAQKHAAESFVSYKVVTKTTRESFLQHEFHVRRRYQDFLWLSNILIQQYPSNVIPPLPQKKMFNKYDPNFLRLRQLALNKFLCRIAEHPILSASEHFFTFLSAKQVELIEQKKTTSLKKFTIPQLPINNLESPFKTTSEYIEEFGKILSALSTQSSKLDKEQSELENALNALSPSLALWANSEGDLEPTLSKLGEIVSKNSEELGKLVAIKEEIFSEGIKEYQLYINTVKNVLKTRDHMQVTKEYFTETVLSKQRELEKLEANEPGKSFATFFGKSPAAVKEEKMTKLKNDITSLSADGEAAGDELVVASASIRSDIERWKINKEKDFRSLLDSVAESNLACCKTSAEQWESLIQFIDEIEP